jgi:hypothetical protein
MAKKSNAAKIREYIVANPKAKSGDVAEKFGAKLAYVYVLRSQVKKAVGKYMRPDGTLKQRMQSVESVAAASKKNDEWKTLHVSSSDHAVDALSSTPDMVNHPPHYKVGGIETIDFIEAKGLNYHLGNVVKYVTRADHKGERLENLQKAKWYLEREIASVTAK